MPTPKKPVVTVNLVMPIQKKHVVRLDAVEDDAAVKSLYVSNEAYEKLGKPQAVKLTVEAA